MQKGMNEFLKLQTEAYSRYRIFCDLRRNNKSKDDIDYAHERYHFTKVEMQHLKDKHKLVFAV